MRVELTQGLCLSFDEIDADLIAPFKWFAHKQFQTYYARRNTQREFGKQRTVIAHRLILNASAGQMVDHIDGNGLNCHRSNLRFVTAKQNAQNRARRLDSAFQFKGIREQRGKFYAYIRDGDRLYRSAAFLTDTEAAHEYDRIALDLFGEFARLNFPLEERVAS